MESQSESTEPATLEFESPHFLQSLFANDFSLLKVLESAFALKVTTRDGWMKFDGKQEDVARAKQVFRELESARRKGAEISKHVFQFAVETVSRGGEGGIVDLMSCRMLGSATKPPVVPKTAGQLAYVQSMDRQDVVFGVGPAGTGKTYLAMAKALQSLEDGAVNRLVLTRPAVEAGEALGFLPGDMKEKIFPYLRPLYDALYDMLEPQLVEKYIDRGMIEIAPLAYMRGRTLNRAFIILDEAQNTTGEQMLMFLTRLGIDARCVITGDPSQVDLKNSVESGLREAMRVLRGTEGVDFVEFGRRDVVRHPVVQNIIDAYNQGRNGKNGPSEGAS